MTDHDNTSGWSGRLGERDRLLVLAAFVAIAGLWCWLEWRALGSARAGAADGLVQLGAMQVDADAIIALRRRPVAAASRSRPNEELLAQVERSLGAAGIDHHQWQDSIPQPVTRKPGSDYRRHSTRIILSEVTLKQLATFVRNITAADPTLHASAITISNRKEEFEYFDVDIAVSYRVFAPDSK
jgi:hypothetical protein